MRQTSQHRPQEPARLYGVRYAAAYAAGAMYLDVLRPTRALAEFIRQHSFSPGSKVLDLGCGEGRDSVFLANCGFRVIGIDASEAAIGRARRRAGREKVRTRFLVGDMVQLGGLDSSSFDLVTCIDAIHLIIDFKARARHFLEVLRVLKPGGHYFLCAHTGERTEVRSRQGGMRAVTVRVQGKPVQIRIPWVPALIKTNRGYVRELRSSGFKVVSAVTTHSEPIPAPVCVIDALKEP